eukprot:1161955-Pelagomonas_calceolata.AAC.12
MLSSPKRKPIPLGQTAGEDTSAVRTALFALHGWISTGARVQDPSHMALAYQTERDQRKGQSAHGQHPPVLTPALTCT